MKLVFSILSLLSKQSLINVVCILFCSVLSAYVDSVLIFSLVPLLVLLITPQSFFLQFPRLENLTFVIHIVGLDQHILFSLIIIFLALITTIRLLSLSFSNLLSSKISSELSTLVYKSFLFTDFTYSVSLKTNSLLLNATTHIALAASSINLFIQFLSSILFLLFTVVTITYLQGSSVLLIFILTGLLFFIYSRLTKKIFISNSSIVKDSLESILSLLRFSLNDLRLIHLRDYPPLLINQYSHFNNRLYDRRAINRILSLSPKPVIEVFFIVCIFIYSVYLISLGQSSELILADLSTLGIVSVKILPAFQQLFSAWSGIKGSSKESLAVIHFTKENLKFYSERHSNFDKTLLIYEYNEENPCIIRANNLSFGYNSSNTYLFRNLNFSIYAKDKVSIVGDSGTGKSTLFDLLLSLRAPSDGKLIFNVSPLDSFSKLQSSSQSVLNLFYMSHLSLCSQSSYLFGDTLLEYFGSKLPTFKHDFEYLNYLLEIFICSDFLGASPINFRNNPQLSDGGSNFSGGQRQRLAIVRSLYSKPSILFLDEPTSALDFATEKLVIDNLFSNFDHLTILSISHGSYLTNRSTKSILLSDIS